MLKNISSGSFLFSCTIFISLCRISFYMLKLSFSASGGTAWEKCCFHSFKIYFPLIWWIIHSYYFDKCIREWLSMLSTCCHNLEGRIWIAFIFLIYSPTQKLELHFSHYYLYFNMFLNSSIKLLHTILLILTRPLQKKFSVSLYQPDNPFF